MAGGDRLTKGADRELLNFYEVVEMDVWTYTLENGQTGFVRAAGDDEAWNKVLAMLGQCPVRIRRAGVAVDEVAA
jgi:hypothetical protein